MFCAKDNDTITEESNNWSVIITVLVNTKIRPRL